jgi:hypothetical protein
LLIPDEANPNAASVDRQFDFASADCGPYDTSFFAGLRLIFCAAYGIPHGRHATASSSFFFRAETVETTTDSSSWQRANRNSVVDLWHELVTRLELHHTVIKHNAVYFLRQFSHQNLLCLGSLVRQRLSRRLPRLSAAATDCWRRSSRSASKQQRQ